MGSFGSIQQRDHKQKNVQTRKCLINDRFYDGVYMWRGSFIYLIRFARNWQRHSSRISSWTFHFLVPCRHSLYLMCDYCCNEITQWFEQVNDVMVAQSFLSSSHFVTDLASYWTLLGFHTLEGHYREFDYCIGHLSPLAIPLLEEK